MIKWKIDHLERELDDGSLEDPYLSKSSLANDWRSPPLLLLVDVPLPKYWPLGLWCMAHEEVWAIGSKSEDKSYVAGLMDEEDANGRLASETIEGAMVACGGEVFGGWGTSYVAMWPCK